MGLYSLKTENNIICKQKKQKYLIKDKIIYYIPNLLSPIQMFNILICDDTWSNLQALIHVIKRVKIENIQFKIDDINDGYLGVELFK